MEEEDFRVLLKKQAGWWRVYVVFNDVYSRDMSSLDIASDFNINLICTPFALRSVSKEYKDKFTIINDIWYFIY